MNETPAAPPPSDRPPSEPAGPTEPAAAPPASEAYPVVVDCERQDEYNRFLPLVKWLLALPHYIVLFFLVIGVFFAKIIAFFAVIITRNYPQGIFGFVTGVLRWSWNVNAYVFLLTDRYPPFSLEQEADHPVEFEIAYPADGVARWRPLVQWLLIIPFAIVAAVLVAVAEVVALIGVFVILFTKNLPEGMFKLILIPFRWQFRGYVYSMFMVTRYPPFEWEEPAAASPATRPGP
jgi:hypothetical protein